MQNIAWNQTPYPNHHQKHDKNLMLFRHSCIQIGHLIAKIHKTKSKNELKITPDKKKT
jgi:hypothetical protein